MFCEAKLANEISDFVLVRVTGHLEPPHAIDYVVIALPKRGAWKSLWLFGSASYNLNKLK
jgi:hypothetical protein